MITDTDSSSDAAPPEKTPSVVGSVKGKWGAKAAVLEESSESQPTPVRAAISDVDGLCSLDRYP